MKVTELDVLRPFAILFTLNLVILLVWTLLDPPYYDRVEETETSSYGTCKFGKTNATWKVCISILVFLNGASLFLAVRISVMYKRSLHPIFPRISL